MQTYDVQAPIAVIEAAGGIVSNWQGGAAHQGGQILAAANREIHAGALALLAAASGGDILGKAKRESLRNA